MLSLRQLEAVRGTGPRFHRQLVGQWWAWHGGQEREKAQLWLMDFWEQNMTSKHVFLLGNIFPTTMNTDPKTFPLGTMFCLQNITYFWAPNIHPKIVYFGKENILHFEAETMKEQRNCSFLSPKSRSFPLMKRPPKIGGVLHFRLPWSTPPRASFFAILKWPKGGVFWLGGPWALG